MEPPPASPVAYDQRPPHDRSRLAIFFRIPLLIPHYLELLLIGVALFFTIVAAWFAIVLTGRHPAGLHAFNAGALRWYGRLVAYQYLLVDAYPSFGFGEHPEYPIRIAVAPPQPSYSRAKALFRAVLAIPVAIVLLFMQLWLQAVAIGLWFAGVITGRTDFVEVVRTPMAYFVRATAYTWLLTEDWPPLDPGPGVLPTPPPPGAGSAPAAPPGASPW